MNRSYLAIFGLIALDVYAGNPIDLCEHEIRSSKTFGNDAVIKTPVVSSENDKVIIYDWTGDSLLITLNDEARTPAIARCVYRKEKNKVEFLNVYSETLISNYPNELLALKTATEQEAYSIALKLGISEQQILWLKWGGSGYSRLGVYNPDGKINGLARIEKSDLIHLDKLHIINLYSVSLLDHIKSDDEHYFSVGTEISRLLTDRL